VLKPIIQNWQTEMDILNKIKQIQALAETGIHYSHNPFELQRNQEIGALCLGILSDLTGTAVDRLKFSIEEHQGYKTPKVDVRAVIFNERNEILLVREKVDGRWSLPGGWADIGYTPSEVAVKEAREEAGAEVDAVRILAVFDKRCHEHPADIYYIYKIFIECRLRGWVGRDDKETSDQGFFSPGDLPPLSTPRVTARQIEQLLALHTGKLQAPLFD
jgi:ADP-ribose pyrophosphatase YjhB (NUDIX family)